MTQTIAIILCRDRTPCAEREALVASLAADLERRPGLDVTLLPHLYDLAPNGPAVELLRSVPGPMVVLAWLYPRAAFWVLHAHGVRGRWGRTSSSQEHDAREPAAPARADGGASWQPASTQDSVPDRAIWCMDLREHERAEPFLTELERIIQGVLPPGGEMPAPEGKARIVEEATRPRWYPVVDYGRCASCLECLNFCLFGVYSLGQRDAVLVEQPDACRNGCPACSRVCPEGAIMFPQHKDPAIAGDPKVARKGLKLDLPQLFGEAAASRLAAGERGRALAEKDGEGQQPGTSRPVRAQSGDDLDRLVGEVDGLEL
jgi:hypothetical protein